MGLEMVAGFRETEKHSSISETNERNIANSSKVIAVSASETVILMPEGLHDSNTCQSSSVEASNAAINSENPSNFSGGNAEVCESKEERESWVVDVKCGDEEAWEGERVCRICHMDSELDSKAVPKAKTKLIRLGCECKGELSFVHLSCAEAWFKLKGNRMCEICGETVKNVRGIGNEAFMDEWRETTSAPDLSERTEEEGCWHGQPFCNFLMACLVIAFVLPWFFRINIF